MRDWKQLLEDLKARGWTQKALADEVGAAQSTISDLYRGITDQPTYGIGRALELLHESNRVPEEKAA